MKTIVHSFQSIGWLLGIGFVLAGNSLSASPEDQPVITSIHVQGNNVVVTAQVPAGIKRVTLEGRSRLGAGSWEPRAVTRLEGGGGQVTFRLPKAAGLEVLRVRADDREALPAGFYSGTNSFLGQPVNSGSVNGVFAAAPGGSRGADPAAGAPSRDVVESDIWKISGGTLYFFNQYRALQVIDISTPDAATVKGVLPLPAAGEQMYLLDASHVVLLARDGCGWWGGESESRVLVVDVGGATPKVAGSLPLTGNIQESRLVGTALYVAHETYLKKPTPTGELVWEWGTEVSSFDLSNQAAPLAKSSLWFSGSGNVISATDVFLFVSVVSPTNYWRSIVHCLDITAPDGTMNDVASIATAGRVKDKFKLNRSEENKT